MRKRKKTEREREEKEKECAKHEESRGENKGALRYRRHHCFQIKLNGK